MFNLIESDIFREGDIVVAVKVGQLPLKAQINAAMAAMDYVQYAYSNRGEHEELLFIKDTDARLTTPQHGSISPGIFRGIAGSELCLCAS